MISFFETVLAQLSVHRVGNKGEGELYTLSEAPIAVADELLKTLLMQYFVRPYEKLNEMYHFYHPSNNLALNEVYHFASAMFDDPDSFHENSVQIAKHLYDVSTHPKIKAGEVYFVYFKDLQIDGELMDAIGIFKSETKETYLKIYQEQKGFNLSYEQEGININKLDKGCIVFNTERAEGYRVAVIDLTNRSTEAVYWKDDFLKLMVRNDNYNQTNNVLGVYKNFVTEKLEEEFDVSKTDKIDFLNRSMKYFKENDSFDLDEFSEQVIGDPQGIKSFKKYKESYEEEFDVQINNSFEISGAAVKKQARVYKSVLKLDKNFHIYIHGDKELIEKGFDDEKGLNFYKVFFKEEA